MKAKTTALVAALISISFISCDDTTDSIGSSLIGQTDNLKVMADTFNVISRSILADSVIARTGTGYLGRMKDPETGATITGNFMAQLHVLNNYGLPTLDSIMSRDQNNEIIADSCDIKLFYASYNGDSTSQMKLTAYELNHPVEEGQIYYSNLDPQALGYIRMGGIAEKRTYTLINFTEPESVRKDSTYVKNIDIKLNKQYTDKNGQTYNNYGTYLMRKYLQDSTAFRNSYRFLHEVCPGFYFKTTYGIGSMAHVEAVQLNIYFNLRVNNKIRAASTNFNSTEEVLQITNFSQDRGQLEQMAQTPGYTFLKTPAGLFTELTLPVDSIMKGHEKDTLNSVKLDLKRVNNTSFSHFQMPFPKDILILPADSLSSFFARNKVIDYQTSFTATYSSATNSYTFNNLAALIKYFHRTKQNASSNWAKVILVPVDVQTTSSQYGGKTLTRIIKISNLMELSSVKLFGGADNSDAIKMSVVYSKFNG